MANSNKSNVGIIPIAFARLLSICIPMIIRAIPKIGPKINNITFNIVHSTSMTKKHFPLPPAPPPFSLKTNKKVWELYCFTLKSGLRIANWNG